MCLFYKAELKGGPNFNDTLIIKLGNDRFFVL